MRHANHRRNERQEPNTKECKKQAMFAKLMRRRTQEVLIAPEKNITILQSNNQIINTALNAF
jgi:hypothetical protein